MTAALRSQDGQVLPLVAIVMVVLLLCVGMAFDVGRVLVAQQQLQTAVNAAALAAGQELESSGSLTAYSTAINYSGKSGDLNAVGGFEVSAANPTVTFECNPYATNYTAASGSTPASCPADASGDKCDPTATGVQTPIPSGATTCNAVNVKEAATVKNTFLGIDLPSFTVYASATASEGGGIVTPQNVYVILDNTNSMTDVNSSCAVGAPAGQAGSGIPSASVTEIDCAKSGVRALLQALAPCSSTSACGAATAYPAATGSAEANQSNELGANVANPVDEVGMLVFPAINGSTCTSSSCTLKTPTLATVENETACNTSTNASFSTIYPPWTDPTTSTTLASDAFMGYQAVGLSSDYRQDSATSDTTLNFTPGTDSLSSAVSPLVESVDWGQCPGSVYPAKSGGSNPYPYNYGLDDVGGHHSYLAGAISTAQYLLAQNARPNADNVIVILSDGQLNTPDNEPASVNNDPNPCYDAYLAAQQAKAAGDTIYTIEYNTSPSSPGTCGADADPGKQDPDAPTGIDVPNPDPYDSPPTLMQAIASSPSDYFDDPTGGALAAKFQQVGADLTTARLLADCTATASC